MKKSLSVLAVLMLSICFVLAGCSPNLKLPENKVVSSNGGRVVMVDDYVYYANTFIDYSALKKGDNTTSSVKFNSINRVKTDKFGFIVTNEDKEIQNNEQVYSKMAGFNNSHMFVNGDYLYYTSPNAHKSKEGQTLFNLTTLFRVKLNGKNNQEILSTKTTQGQFYLVTGTKDYLLIFDNNKLQKLELGENLKSPKVLVENVESVIFPKEYGNITDIYYTTEIPKADQEVGLNGNILYRYNLSTNKSIRIAGKQPSQYISFVALENNVLYYKKAVNGEALYYSLTLDEQETQLTYFGETASQDQNGQTQTTDAISYFTPINSENYCFVYNSQLMLNKETTPLVSENVKVQMVSGDYIYYTTDNGLFRISYKDKEIQTVADTKNIQDGSCEIAGEYVYFYAKLKDKENSSYYCYRANNKIIEQKLDNGLNRIQVDCISQLSLEELTAKPENSETPEA